MEAVWGFFIHFPLSFLIYMKVWTPKDFKGFGNAPGLSAKFGV